MYIAVILSAGEAAAKPVESSEIVKVGPQETAAGIDELGSPAGAGSARPAPHT